MIPQYEVDHILVQVVIARREPVAGLEDRTRKVGHVVTDQKLILADPKAEHPYGEPVERLVAEAEQQAKEQGERAG